MYVDYVRNTSPIGATYCIRHTCMPEKKRRLVQAALTTVHGYGHSGGITGIEDFVQRRIVEDRVSHKRLSEELMSMYPHIQCGLS